MEFLQGRGLMGHERLETELLLAALEKRPQCVSFVGQAWDPRKMAWDFWILNVVYLPGTQARPLNVLTPVPHTIL